MPIRLLSFSLSAITISPPPYHDAIASAAAAASAKEACHMIVITTPDITTTDASARLAISMPSHTPPEDAHCASLPLFSLLAIIAEELRMPTPR
jgi:DNA-binding MurR/RpiR family transcriptional regulator